MKENNYNNENCDTCSADFQNEVSELVDNVEGYSNEDHSRKEEEVDAAFGKETENREKQPQHCER